MCENARNNKVAPSCRECRVEEKVNIFQRRRIFREHLKLLTLLMFLQHFFFHCSCFATTIEEVTNKFLEFLIFFLQLTSFVQPSQFLLVLEFFNYHSRNIDNKSLNSISIKRNVSLIHILHVKNVYNIF